MRTKSCGSKARVSKIPQIVSSMAAPPLPPPLNGKCDLLIKMENMEDIDRNQGNVCATTTIEHSTRHRHAAKRVKWSLNDDDDDEEANIANGKPKMDKHTSHYGRAASIAPQEVPADSCDGLYLSCLAKLEWTALGLCVVCKKGKQPVMSCGSSDCVFVVHASCLGFQPSFDDTGRFYCPPCSYKRLTCEFGQVKKEVVLAKEKVHSVKNFLSSFLTSTTHEEPTVRRQREEQIPSRIIGDCCGTSSNQDSIGISKDQEEPIHSKVNSKDSSMIEQSLASKRYDSILTGKGGHAKQVCSAQHKSKDDQQEQINNLQQKGNTNVKSTGVMGDQQKKSVDSSECAKDSSGIEQSLASKRNDGVPIRKGDHAKQGFSAQHKSTVDQQEQFDNLQQRGTSNYNSTGIMEGQQKPVDSKECPKDTSAVEPTLASKRNDSMTTGGDHSKQVRNGQHKRMEVQQDEVSEDQCTSGNLGDDIPLKNEIKDTAVTTGKRNKSAKRSPNIALPGSRRKKLHWTEEEENMLKV